MADITIVLGNKAYSSWSLRGWLLLKRTGADFDEIVVPLDRPETAEAIRAHSPSGRVPALQAGALWVWDTLAIAETLAERFPAAHLWPEDPAARAHARSVVAEMHAGFATLRARLPMDLKRPPLPPGSTRPEGELGAEIARILEIWQDCRGRHGGAGRFLFGPFGAADAFYAPVVTRFVTHGFALAGAAAAYRDAIMDWPDLRVWLAAAAAEPWVLENP